MINNSPNKTTAKANEGNFLVILRAFALIALIVGGTGSLVFMFRAGQHTPRFLLVLFTIWVLAPFVALLWANRASKRWSVLTRAALYCVTFIIALNSLAIYGEWIDIKPGES